MHTLFARSLWVLIVSWGALPAAAQKVELPEPQSRLTLSELAQQMAGNARGLVLASKAASDGDEYPTRLKVWYSRYGSLAHDDVVEFTWDTAHPPFRLGGAAARERDPNPLCLFDVNKRLLCVSYEDDARQDWLLSTVGMARLPSQRFSARELELAWIAAQRDLGGRWFESMGPESFEQSRRMPQLGDFDLEPGHLELWLRFAKSGSRVVYANSFSLFRKPEPADVERLRWCTWDPCAEHAALHALLDNGLSAPLSQLLGESTRLCARVAQGDAAARESVLLDLARLEKLLSWKPAEPHSETDVREHQALHNTFPNREMQAALVETAAYGSKAALPTLRALVQAELENSAFAWLCLGGDADELIALRGGNVLRIPVGELARAGSFDALKLMLMQLSAQSKGNSAFNPYFDFGYLDRLIRVLRSKNPGRVLELVRPALRALMEGDLVRRFSLCIALLHAGDESALDDLCQLESPNSFEAPTLARELASVPGPRAVGILTRLLLRAHEGYPFDDTGQGSHDVAVLTSALHQRSAADRALALQIFDAGPNAREIQSGGPAIIRWSLGELPAPEQLRDMELSSVIQSCGLSLEADRARYASLLPELRAEPRKYWLQLALLHDETALPESGAWLQELVQARQGLFWPLCALRLMADPRAASFFTAEPEALLPGTLEDYFAVLGSIESPAWLPSVANRGLAAKSPAAQSVWHEFLILLGRRN